MLLRSGKPGGPEKPFTRAVFLTYSFTTNIQERNKEEKEGECCERVLKGLLFDCGEDPVNFFTVA